MLPVYCDSATGSARARSVPRSLEKRVRGWVRFQFLEDMQEQKVWPPPLLLTGRGFWELGYRLAAISGWRQFQAGCNFRLAAISG